MPELIHCVGTAQPITERRLFPRKKSRVNAILPTQLRLDGRGDRIYLYLVDISRGGMRFNTNRELPTGSDVILQFPLTSFESPLSERGSLWLPCHVVWNKRLAGGAWTHGVRFGELDAVSRSQVDEIVESFSPDGHRTRFRLHRRLEADVQVNPGESWETVHASNISVEGIGFRLERALREGDTVRVRVHLEFGLPPMELAACVAWRDRVDLGKYAYGFQFRDTLEEEALILQEYIFRCLEEEFGPDV
ncbi:MAG: PilZ domain-containing protein [Armatimonadetes bacterium]|nr:PilZ domain-containing protein [Armatimonadota bacterium]